jgi:hypothetical protein
VGFEPSAQRRLHRVWATTSDPILRRELRTTLEDPEMPFVPSPELLRQINSCAGCEHQDHRMTRDGLCETHRSRWNLELCSVDSFTDDGDAELNQIMRTLLADENHGRQLLGTLERQLRALHLVWDAHQIGAVRLPERIAEVVRLARLGAPASVPGKSKSVKQAS